MVKRGTQEYPVPGVGSGQAANPFISLFMSTAGPFENGKWYVTGGSGWHMLLAFDSPFTSQQVWKYLEKSYKLKL